MNEQDQVAEALYFAERSAFNWPGAPLATRAQYLCLAGVAIGKLDELRAPKPEDPAADEQQVLDEAASVLPSFEGGFVGSGDWRTRSGLR